MTINLKKFTKKLEAIVPIVDGWGQYRNRKIYASQIKTPGYYKTSLQNSITVHGSATALEIYKFLKSAIRQDCDVIKGYALGEEIIPISFDSVFRKGFVESIRVNFLSQPLFTTVEAVVWEDNRLFFYDTIIPKNQSVIRKIRGLFNQDKPLLGVRGTTPELRYYFLLGNLQREGFRAAEEFEKLKLSDEEKNRRIKDLEKLLPNRIRNAVRNAGGTFLRTSKLGRGILVEWEVGGQKIKSVINDEMRIINAGYCLAGSDHKHSLSSIINLAKLFQEAEPLYITRE